MDEAHTPFLIRHLKIFIPNPRPVTVVFGLFGLVITPEPEIIDQVPTPIVAVFPANVVLAELIHTVWFGPAMAMLERLSTWILMVDVVVGQTPFEIFHCKTLIPKLAPVTAVVGLFGETIVALPLITDQVPTPVVGVFPANIVDGLLIQSVWLAPAEEILGAGSTCIVIDEIVCGQAPLLVILQCKTFNPRPRLVTVVFGVLGLVIVPDPLITDHVPMPTVGVLPESVVLGELIQTV